MDKKLPDKRGVLLKMYDERAFSRDAISRLPELASKLRVEENLLHVQMSILGNVVHDELSHTAVKLTPRIFVLLEEALTHPRVVAEISNAVATSFVEIDVLQKTEAGRLIVETMPPKLKSIVLQRKV